MLLDPYLPSDMSRAASDRLSNLPSSLIENILMRLPLFETARTCILSTEWRYKWARMPQLVFDFASGNPKTQPAFQDKLFSTIFQIFLLHQEPILKFNLRAYSGSSAEINQVIHFLSRNPVEDFTLCSVIRNAVLDKLSSPLFSCQQLKRLNLTNCVLKPPSTFQGFKKLTILELINVWFEGDSLTHFISSCPLLQLLYIVNKPTYTAECLEINHPNLHSLFIKGNFKSISLANYSKLSQVLFIPYVTFWKMDHIQEFLNSLLSVQDLCIGNTALILCRELNGRQLSNLRTLTLAEMSHSGTEFSGALRLISRSPNLRTLHLQIQERNPYVHLQPENYLQLQGIKPSFNHLHEIRIVNFRSFRLELQFLEFLLANSPRLKKVHIYPSRQGCNANETFMTLLQFTRASPTAKIEFGDPKAIWRLR